MTNEEILEKIGDNYHKESKRKDGIKGQEPYLHFTIIKQSKNKYFIHMEEWGWYCNNPDFVYELTVTEQELLDIIMNRENIVGAVHDYLTKEIGPVYDYYYEDDKQRLITKYNIKGNYQGKDVLEKYHHRKRKSI